MEERYRDQSIPPRAEGGQRGKSGEKPRILLSDQALLRLDASEISRAAFTGSSGEETDRESRISYGSPRPAEDARIPERSETGRTSLSTSSQGGSKTGSGKSVWNFISREELFSGYRESGQKRMSEREREQMPGAIRKLYQMCDPCQYQLTEKSAAFVKQAREMEGYEDNFDYRARCRFHTQPAYQDLSLMELRGYFSFRSRLRKGEIPEGNITFLMIYLYELMNGIGWKDPEEGFRKILALQENYGQMSSWPVQHMPLWIQDFIVVYDLGRSYVKDYFLKEILEDEKPLTICFWEDADPEDLCRALDSYSNYSIGKSLFYQTEPETAQKITARVFSALALSYWEKNKSSYGLDLIGTPLRVSYKPFSGALFATPRSRIGYQFIVDPLRTYSCRENGWSRTLYWRGMSSMDENWKELSRILHETDRLMRKAFHFGRPLKAVKLEMELEELIQGEIDRFLQEKKAAEKPEIEVDLSKLHTIRKAAAITRDRLLEGTEETEGFPLPEGVIRLPDSLLEGTSDLGREERAPQEQLPGKLSGAEAAERPHPWNEGSEGIFAGETLQDLEGLHETEKQQDEKEQKKQAEQGAMDGGEREQTEESETSPTLPFEMTEEEFAILRMSLRGENPAPYAEAHHLLLSVAVDALNEKLFDEIGDSVLEEDQGIRIVEDYRPDLEALLGDSI